MSLRTFTDAVSPPGSYQTQGPVTTATVILTGVFVRLLDGRSLSARMVHLDVHGTVDHEGDIVAAMTREFIGALDIFQLPVGPIQVILKQRHGENVRKLLHDHVTSFISVESCHGDIIIARVGPEYMIGDIVHSESVGPAQVILYDSCFL